MHECEVTQADLQDLRNEMQDKIDDLLRDIEDLREKVQNV